MAALAKRYRAPEWALFEQVGNGTGHASNRWADAMAMSLWPSRGLHLHGFEVKVYRHDWLRELRNPSKAEEIATYCDFWWIVTDAPDVALVDELPVPWGLMEVTGRGFTIHKQAVQRVPAADLDRPMVAALLRRASEAMVPKSSIQAEMTARYEEGERNGLERAGRRDDESARDLKALRESVAQFERESGIAIGEYNGGDLGRVVAQVKALNAVTQSYRLEQAESYFAAALEALRAARASLQATA